MHRVVRRLKRGLTLIELLVVVALVAIVLAIGVPNFRDYIVLNRLKAVTAQLVTDLQFARSEATARNTPVYWTYRATGSGSSTITCYTIYTTSVPGLKCNCANGPGAACGPNRTELKVVQVAVRDRIELDLGQGEDSFAFDNVSGGIYFGTTDFSVATLTDFRIVAFISSDSTKVLRTNISPAGRPTVCSAGSKRIQGYPLCP